MKGRSKFWGPQYMVSKLQLDMVYNIRTYRQKHNLSLQQMVDILNSYGAPHNVKFSINDVWKYEEMKTAPRYNKYRIICNALNIA